MAIQYPTGRPKGGYVNAAGEKIPGTTTIVGRFKESAGLIIWAHNCGLSGLSISDVRDRAADAGTACHEMIDAHMHNREFTGEGCSAAVIASAKHAFKGFLEWEEQSALVLAASEVSLVSERHQFGGTFDAAYMAGTLRLLDYKTSSGVYVDMLVQVAGGYSLLWEEHRPTKPLAGIDILRVSRPKNPSDPVSFDHRHWSAEIIPMAQRQFLLMREAYDLDKRLRGLL